MKIVVVLYINKTQQDAAVCRYLLVFTANLLYMFRVSIAPIIRSTKTLPEAAVTVFCSPDDGYDGHTKHVELICSK